MSLILLSAIKSEDEQLGDRFVANRMFIPGYCLVILSFARKNLPIHLTVSFKADSNPFSAH